MSDFINNFWNMYVVVLVVASLLFCAFIVLSNRSARPKGPVELHGHQWDETLAEWNNPLPRWWVWLFWITIIFSVIYLVAYPGLGSLGNALGWSATGAYDKEVATAEAKVAPLFDRYAAMDIKQVAADPEARAMGERLFLNNCAVCHGTDARGSRGFPNLTDKDWLYGGEPETIVATLTNGRNGAMPAFGGALDSEQVRDVANYVRSLSGLAADSIRVQRGKTLFATNCVACHGPEGKGNQLMGAPNLTDGIWLYGSTEPIIVQTITKGRAGHMPAHEELLGEKKIHLLAAYVWGLSNKGDGAK
ncbi:cytochrome-c oxidase, cbb3-type subunit III [Methyloversatilis thermotolerans]|uniref:cytochrome-c oxidase, cbb3-type subunit III n=1 Tax=Methyloversatilis thermotolerans TaxID=1346290 RepID=UPI00035FE1D9|nr:cytochrome-c oxidase, cbb3-type subunit III [Methyloversatilis thermotolerans]